MQSRCHLPVLEVVDGVQVQRVKYEYRLASSSVLSAQNEVASEVDNLLVNLSTLRSHEP